MAASSVPFFMNGRVPAVEFLFYLWLVSGGVICRFSMVFCLIFHRCVCWLSWAVF
jgi:hypothetical protein